MNALDVLGLLAQSAIAALIPVCACLALFFAIASISGGTAVFTAAECFVHALLLMAATKLCIILHKKGNDGLAS